MVADPGSAGGETGPDQLFLLREFGLKHPVFYIIPKLKFCEIMGGGTLAWGICLTSRCFGAGPSSKQRDVKQIPLASVPPP